MATYTTLDSSTVQTLLSAYNLGEIRDITPMSGGNANSSMIIDTGASKYVLSVCDEKNFDEISSLTATLDLLNKNTFPTSRLVKTVEGDSCLHYQGKPVYVKEFIDGTVVKKLTPQMISQVGEALAKLHAIAPERYHPNGFAYGLADFPTLFDRQGDYPAWLADKTEMLKRCCPTGLPKGLIHGDLFYDNILFTGPNLSALLDFEEVCNYYLIFDLGMCAAGCCPTDSGFSLKLARALAEGYQRIRPLEPIERDLFQSHVVYGATATSFWRYRQFNVIIPTPDRAEDHLEMTMLADEVHAIPPQDFLQEVFV